MIKAENFSYGFADKELYHKISFTLEDGQHCALIGSNGTGKTTLTDILHHPDEYLYDGRLIMDGMGRIGYVSQFASREKEQNITVFDYLSSDFIRLQDDIASICVEMSSSSDLDALLEKYQLLLDESMAIDADNFEVNIRRRLHLAELEDKASLELSKLSGGEYKLIQIIREMLHCPGLLIMDEPDVFLDFDNLKGLRDLINAYDGTMLVITHNRYLLNNCFNCIWHLENADLQEYSGNYIEYNFSLMQEKLELQEKAEADELAIQLTTEMVDRLREEASEVIDPLRGRTLKGKVSYLERLKARQIKAPFVEIREPEIRLPDTASPEVPEVLLTVENYKLSFDEKLLENVNFTIKSNEKVAIVGPNGTGKTTLLRAIQSGNNPSIRFSENAKVGFFSQLHEDTLNESNTIYKEFHNLGFDTPFDVEKHLAGYCFDSETLDRKISQLSGGEKNLLQLAKLAVSGANFLLLDEPSSHLDTYAQAALEKAISSYNGAVLMVSHDFYSIVSCVDSVLLVENGTIRPMSGRAFRKMIYKRHFSRKYLELELKKKELETKIARALEAGNRKAAKKLCDELGAIVEQL